MAWSSRICSFALFGPGNPGSLTCVRTVLPDGRFIGQNRTFWPILKPCGRKSLVADFWPILKISEKMADFWPILKNFEKMTNFRPILRIFQKMTDFQTNF